ncbi:MAG: TetR/AcrR family transcriptional regulator [Actinomycetota bacterium]|nr:TetR/AcrR family transcriptional regulator [Actinomycetota bacterium]
MATEPPKRRGRPPSGGREAILDATLELLRERGVASVTSREVAQRAGVSDASVYYHYTDKAGLLRAVFESGLQPLQALDERGITRGDRHETLISLAQAIEQFLNQALPVVMAAQSDAELRDDLAAYMAEHDLGPHRGVQTLGAYLIAEQVAGRIAANADAETIAFLLVAACFLRAAQRQIMGHAHAEPLPTLEQTIATLDALLRPPGD